MKLIEKAWYVAAWREEVHAMPFRRVLLGEPVVLYRLDDGKAVALGNVCPHRFASLHMGRRIGDAIECRYHGLQFDPAGHCIHNPHGPISAALKVRSYAVEERDDLVWIWTGDAHEADPGLIPDFGYLNDTRRRHLRPPPVTVQAHHELFTDNLLDLTHINYVHGQTAGLPISDEVKHTVSQNGSEIHSIYTIAGTRSKLSTYLGDPDMLVDIWLDMVWNPPSCLYLVSGVTPAGKSRDQGITNIGTHILTPESENATHYFLCSSRDFALEDPEADAFWAAWQENALTKEDKVIVEEVHRNMKGADLLDQRPALFKTDAALVRARRLLEALRREESQSVRAA